MQRKIKIFGIYTFDRYIFTSFFKTLLVSIAFFVGIYFFASLLAEVPTLLKKSDGNPMITIPNVLKLYFLKIPNFFITVIPFAFVFSTAYVLGSFYKNNEIIAIISSGWSMRRITISVVISSFFFSFGLLFMNSSLIPDYNFLSAQLEDKLYSEVKVQDVDNIQTYGEDGVSYFARYYNAKNKIFVSFIILKKINGQKFIVQQGSATDFDNLSNLSVTQQIKTITETSLMLKSDFPYEWIIKGEQLLWDEKLSQWIVKDGYKWIWDNKGNIVKIEDLYDNAITLNEKPEFFNKETRNIREMSISESLVYIDKLRKSKQAYKKELVEYYSEKFAKPFSVFILALLSSTLGRFFSRKHLLVMTLVFSFAIALFYYVFLNIGISLGKEGIIPPLPAAFMANGISILFYFYLRKYQLT